MNLMRGLKQEIIRCGELVEEYKKIPTGLFGAKMIQVDIDRAEDAMASGDLTDMIRACAALQECE